MFSRKRVLIKMTVSHQYLLVFPTLTIKVSFYSLLMFHLFLILFLIKIMPLKILYFKLDLLFTIKIIMNYNI
jgi:hypothetical protein